MSGASRWIFTTLASDSLVVSTRTYKFGAHVVVFTYTSGIGPRRSFLKLSEHILELLEGFEPSPAEWKSVMLPLNTKEA